ncbi:hypothetical protein MSAN_02339800 [Mycena sanguinolenta]|uniref:Uncharacterized protein n=1 Tax=Mycena sanguinolenta TaxID=230812 RepID=A0A8H7CGA5_9AGAR|nr:hypothetical protein MSAN_02339800 [Mycena sanguinolenta]
MLTTHGRLCRVLVFPSSLLLRRRKEKKAAMRSAVAVPFAVLASSVGVALAQTALEIFTPPQPPVQCQPTLITWQGGTPPYIVSVLDNTVDPTTPVISFSGLTNTSITWVDTPPAGDIVLFTIKDSTGLAQNSATMTVGTGGSDSCLSSSSSSGSSTGSSTGSAPSGSSKSSSISTSHASTSTTTTTTPLTTTTTTTTPSTTASSTKPPSSSASATGSGSASASAPSSSNTTGAATQVPAPAFAAALAAVFAFLL